MINTRSDSAEWPRTTWYHIESLCPLPCIYIPIVLWSRPSVDPLTILLIKLLKSYSLVLTFHPTHLPKLELFSGYGSPFFPRRAASAHMTKSLALDPHDLSSRGDLLPSRAGIPPRVASIIWNRNFPSLLSDPSTQIRCTQIHSSCGYVCTCTAVRIPETSQNANVPQVPPELSC